MIPLSEAQQISIDAAHKLESTDIKLEHSTNHVASEDIISPMAVCPFRNSAMDGFAIASECITATPATLEIAATVFAGDILPAQIDKTKALKVMTGAPVPDQYDTVVRFEDTNYDDGQVTINIPIKSGQNIRMPGEDIVEGDTLIRKGRLIRPLDLGVLASVGLEIIPVVRKPRVLIVSTGNELVRPGQPIGVGQIYDSNSYTIEGMTRRFCASIERHSAVVDDHASLTAELSSDHDLIISSGGVSMGEKDYLPGVAEQCGWKPLFHKVAIKPGKPLFMATRGKQILFGLPGNPVSVAVTCALFVIPVLKKLIGIKPHSPVLRDACLDESSAIKSGRSVVWPGRIRQSDNQTYATLSEKRSSAALSALLDSDGLIFLLRDHADSSPVVKVLTWKDIMCL